MKKIIKQIRRWHTHRIFKHWVVFYLKRGLNPNEAIANALTIFSWFSPNLEDFEKWYCREYWGVSNPNSVSDSAGCSSSERKQPQHRP